MTLPSNEKIYCDATFLVDYGSKRVSSIELRRKAYALYAGLVANNCTIVTSPLAFDEAWNGIRKANDKRPIPSFYEITDNMLSTRLQIVQFPNYQGKEGIVQALFNIDKFKLKARDSFHLAIVQKNNIKYLVSRDSDFKDDVGIKILSYDSGNDSEKK
jgi:predicted nucleic acid-binding protein